MSASVASGASAADQRRGNVWALLPLSVLAIVALTVGLVARWQSTSSGKAEGGYFDLFFSDPIHLKAWFATAVAVLACIQLFTAAWIFRKLPLEKPPWVNPLHRWSGRLAFLCSLPVAYHCIFKLGFQSGDNRVLVHSLLGSTFFGAYAAKVLIIRMRRYPVWVIPTAGGLLFTTIIVLWYTSALWFFQLVGEGL
jgi:Family of unknown function (DUF6529)